MLRIALLLSALAAPAHATQEYILPTLFDVTGVAAGDVLNIRQEADAASEVIGTLPPDATRIEVVEERRGWGRVNAGEGSGWVSMRYLAYRTDVWKAGALPDSFRCFGTEPFWSLRAEGDELVLDGIETPDQHFPVRAVLDTGVFRSPERAVAAEGLVLVATPQMCSDGMSDRLFGLRATVVGTGKQPLLLSGCCMIAP